MRNYVSGSHLSFIVSCWFHSSWIGDVMASGHLVHKSLKYLGETVWSTGVLQYHERYCHVYEWLYTGFGLVIGFIEHLHKVTTMLSLIHTLYNSLQHILRLLSVLSLRQLSGNGFQSCRSPSLRVHVLTGRRLSHNSLNSSLVLLITPQHKQHREHLSQHHFYCCVTQLLQVPRREHRFAVGPLMCVRKTVA
jgi:hypothetical protein